MARRHYLVSYDVADDKRRARLVKLLEGDHAQYSVFFCELTAAELASLRATITDIIHQRDDQVLILDLGPESRPLDQGLEVIGSPYQALTRTLVV